MSDLRLHIEILEEESGQMSDVDIEPGSGVVTVGRDRGCRIVLSAPSVSRQHFKFCPDGTGWAVLDEGSTLGTTVNGEKVVPNVLHSVKHGDVVVCPGYELRIQVVAGTDPTLQPDPNALGRLLREADDEIGTPARVWLFTSGEPLPQPLPQEGTSLTVGRSGECDIQIADPFQVVSAVHAKIERNWAGVFLYDTSINGVFVNGHRVRGEAKLQDGDRVTIAVAEEDPDLPLLVYTKEGNAEMPGAHGAGVAKRPPESAAPDPEAVPEPADPEPVPEVPSTHAAPPPDGAESAEISGITDSLIAATKARDGKPNWLLILVLIICALALATVFVWGVLLLR